MSSPSANRLPIHHPEYLYPESRNPYWAKLRDAEGRVYADQDSERHRGEWRSRFPDHARNPSDRELHVELGCNAGHVVVEWAARNPRNAYVGIDWKYKPVHWAAEKARKRELPNVLLFRAHSDRLAYMFGPGEIDHLYLFFPDPWPRKKQWKNRFLTADRLRDAAKVLRKGGIFHIRTDHPGYFEWMEAAVEETKDLWNVLEHTRDLHAGHPDPRSLTIPDVTLFERIFIKEGLPINAFKLQVR